MSVSQTAYYAIIPANVRYCKQLTDGAKLLYGEITALCNEKGFCWATNCYFADLYGKSADTISRWIGELVENEFITSDLDRAGGNLRKIWIKQPGGIGKNTDRVSAKIQIGYRQKSVNPIGKNAEQNNTVNTTLNTTLKNSAGASDPLTHPFQKVGEIYPETFALEAEKQNPIPPVAPSPLSIELHDPETPGVTIYDHIPHKGYPTTEPVGEWQRVNVPQEIEALKTDTVMRLTFTMSRKIPSANYTEYLDAFLIDVQGRGETYTTAKQLKSHFLNWSGRRFEIQCREAKESKPATPTGQPAKIRQL